MDAQKTLLVTAGPAGAAGLDAVNDLLGRGWRVVTVAPMGGGGAAEGFAALVVLERGGAVSEEALLAEEVAIAPMMAALEEQIEEALEGGDGAPVEPPDAPR